jgi:hypothetical protein
MIKKSLAITFLLIAFVAWARELAQADEAKPKTKAELETELMILKQKKAELEVFQEKAKIASEKWQQDLKSGPVGRFQAVTLGEWNIHSGHKRREDVGCSFVQRGPPRICLHRSGQQPVFHNGKIGREAYGYSARVPDMQAATGRAKTVGPRWFPALFNSTGFGLSKSEQALCNFYH